MSAVRDYLDGVNDQIYANLRAKQMETVKDCPRCEHETLAMMIWEAMPPQRAAVMWRCVLCNYVERGEREGIVPQLMQEPKGGTPWKSPT